MVTVEQLAFQRAASDLKVGGEISGSSSPARHAAPRACY